MATTMSQSDIEAALQECAAEPVHIPGTIQPYGCLLALEQGTDTIVSTSENCNAFLGRSASQLLGASASDLLGQDAWHGVRNALARQGIADQAIAAGSFELNGNTCDVRVFETADRHVIEIEPALSTGMEGPEALKTLSYLMAQLQACDTEQRLFDLTVSLMQLLTGFDRVLIYRFDRSFNGEVLSEAKKSGMDSFLGLRFPHWDIPEQARAIMAKLPLRFICDVDQVAVPLLARHGAAPIDLTLANMRGVSPVHLEYLRNMGSAATMTLSVVIEEKLWGIISFHHRKPRVPASGLRDILTSFVQVFSSKLIALRQQTALNKIGALNQLFIEEPRSDPGTDTLITAAAPIVFDVLQADGIAVLSDQDTIVSGMVPDADVLDRLVDVAQEDVEGVAIEALGERFPEYEGKFGQVAGALVVGVQPSRAICIFRGADTQEINWAGNPEKEIEKVDGRVRLSPRGSFSTYLEQVKGRCVPWTDNDLYLLRHLRMSLHAAERQSLLNRLNQQQELMIGELNHRVRNILALVRSVSRQARRRYGSLESYANAIENRIRALASAHDLTSGSFATPVSIHSLINMEFEPFRTLSGNPIRLMGPDWPMKPQVAPIVSLIVHELVTNAAKYGALTAPAGHVEVTLAMQADDYALTWQEVGGPTVHRPNQLGFGMAMIERAVPHELGGTAKVAFDARGLRAEFTLPLKHFASLGDGPATVATRPLKPDAPLKMPQSLRGATALVLEDNFIIAAEMADQLRDVGLADVDVYSTTEEAMAALDAATPALAVLDINLGNGATSHGVALRLSELGVPFLFVSGYNEDIERPPALPRAPRLIKPTSTHEILLAIGGLFGD